MILVKQWREPVGVIYIHHPVLRGIFFINAIHVLGLIPIIENFTMKINDTNIEINYI